MSRNGRGSSQIEVSALRSDGDWRKAPRKPVPSVRESLLDKIYRQQERRRAVPSPSSSSSEPSDPDDETYASSGHSSSSSSSDDES